MPRKGSCTRDVETMLRETGLGRGAHARTLTPAGRGGRGVGQIDSVFRFSHFLRAFIHLLGRDLALRLNLTRFS